MSDKEEISEEKNESLLTKLWNGVLYIFGLYVIGFGFVRVFYDSWTDYEKDRLSLANDLVKRSISLTLKEEHKNPTDALVNATFATVKNNYKLKCANSVIYYSFEYDSDVIWIKTEEDRKSVTAEEVDEVPNNCTIYANGNGRWIETKAKLPKRNYEKKRISLADDIMKSDIRTAFDEEDIEYTEELVNATFAMFKKDYKKECENSKIYYSYELDSEITWIKTEEDKDNITAEEVEETPNNCTTYKKVNGKWEKTKEAPTSTENIKQEDTKNEKFISSCDGATLEEQAIELPCVFNGKTVYFEKQKELYSYMFGTIKVTNWKRFCTKENIGRFLTNIEVSYEDSKEKENNIVGLTPELKDINCAQIKYLLTESGRLSDWIINPETQEINNLGTEYRSQY